LVVIAIISLLAGMLLPALAKAKAKGQGIMCLNNMRQLSLAWFQYAHDSSDRIPYATSGGIASKEPYTWCTGYLDFDSGNPSNWDLTLDIQKSPLWPYCGNSAGIWKCPADKSTVVPLSGPLQGKRVSRVRSMSMSVWQGGNGGTLRFSEGVSSPPWRLYLGLNDFVDPGPSSTLLFWDEREDAINTGSFWVDMSGFPDLPKSTLFNGDMPASYHNRAGGVSFADGHSQIKPWLDPRTAPPIRKNSNWIAGAPIQSPNNPDIVWLQERATRKMQ
jgi:prepilin-type processing-associated H-X9-DG protein